jgi:asparaginyl-tRNA synthetase
VNSERIAVRDALTAASIGKSVTIQGWVRTKRTSKAGLTFLEINDGSSLKNVQVVAPESLPNYATEVDSINTGASVVVEGTVVESPAAGQETEIQASAVSVLGLAPDYPLAKKRHSFEYLRSMAHLRPRTNTFGAVARVRNEVSRAIHGYFQEHGYLWAHTPIITGSDAEGAGQMFTVTSLDLAEPPMSDGHIDFADDLFGRPTHLTVSGQLEAEIMATAFSRVYTFGPTFRAENSNTSRHLAEFWMVEPEIAFADLSDNATLAERLLKYTFKTLLNERQEDLAFFDERIEKGLVAKLEGIVGSEFVRMDYGEAVRILERAKGAKFEFPVSWGIDLQSEHERYLTESHAKKPVIVMNYPKDIKAFYMRVNDDGRTVAAMDVLAPGIGEIVGGSQREERLEMLDARMAERGIDKEHYAWYRDLRRYGTVPHAGFGLGFERTIAYSTGLANVRDAIPFPRTPGNARY